MNKQQALLLLEQGKRVTHKYFSKGEFIVKHPSNNNYYLDENRGLISVTQFWSYRTSLIWETDWKEMSLINVSRVNMSTEEKREFDPELVAHTKFNLNHHIWTNKDGTEVRLRDIPREEKLEILVKLQRKEIVVPFIEEWNYYFIITLKHLYYKNNS